VADHWFSAAARYEILAAIIGAIDHRGRVMTLVDSSVDEDAARAALIETFGFSDSAATAVLDLQVRRFTIHGRELLVEEWERLATEIDR
jgi:DNA gyrase/topoisomerase IV subunit A